VKKYYSEAFVRLKEGDYVRTKKRRIGQIVSLSYLPKSGLHSIHVAFGSKLLCFHDQYDLEKIDAGQV
jgi:hypothetical protein